MSRPTFVWSFERSQIYEVGAALLVLLALPDEKSESRPVIHLAAAAATIGQELTKEESPGIDLFLERREPN
jgi:hypothetical protein